MLNNENYGYLIHPLTQFMDANLKPLTSAYIKVFYAGTSASAYTYSDWEGTLNTSDIMLSMNGSANVIAEKNKAYKVMLCDALHPPSNPIWVKYNLYVISSEIEVISSTQIKDNAYDDESDPVLPNNITDIEQLTFVRNVGADANYTSVTSEERTYGVLIPRPSMEADRGKVPMYKDGNQIGWEPMPEANRIINVTKLAAEGATSWAPIIVSNEYTTLGNISSAMTSLVVSMDTLPDNDYYYEYKFKFTTPETLGITTFSVLDPSGSPVVWLGSAPSLTAGKTYEVSVVGNLAVFGESV